MSFNKYFDGIFILSDDDLILAYANVHVARAIPASGYNKSVKILVTTMLIYNKNHLESGIHLRLLRTLNNA